MSQTTIIISNLEKDDFVLLPDCKLSLAARLKLAILNLGEDSQGNDIVYSISQWAELPFLKRVIAIFKTPEAAARSYSHLESLYDKESPFRLPSSVRLSLQENLLRESKLFDNLADSSELKVTNKLENFRARLNAGEDGYAEPVPQLFDMYEDLLQAGIDILQFNTDEQIDEVRHSRPSVGRSASVTKTLFRPLLLVQTGPKASDPDRPPPSPTITLDQLS